MTSLMWWKETGRTSSRPPSHHYHLEEIIHMVFTLLSRVYLPCIYVLNKIDQISIEELDVIYKIPHCVPISAHHRWNFDDLLEKIWDYLHLVRMWVTCSCNAFCDGMVSELIFVCSMIKLHTFWKSFQECNKTKVICYTQCILKSEWKCLLCEAYRNVMYHNISKCYAV